MKKAILFFIVSAIMFALMIVYIIKSDAPTDAFDNVNGIEVVIFIAIPLFIGLKKCGVIKDE